LFFSKKKTPKPPKPSKKQQPPFEEPTPPTPPAKEKKLPNPFFILRSVNDDDAQLLLRHGVNTMEQLHKASIADITRTGIKKRTAKKIKKEVTKAMKPAKPPKKQKKPKQMKPPKIDKKTSKTLKKQEKKKTRKKIKAPPQPSDTYSYGDYQLYKKEIKTEKGNIRTIHFFSKSKPTDGDAVSLPADFEVKVNAKTGLPYLVKKKE